MMTRILDRFGFRSPIANLFYVRRTMKNANLGKVQFILGIGEKRKKLPIPNYLG